MKSETKPRFKFTFKPQPAALMQSCRKMVFFLTDAQAAALFFAIFLFLGLTVGPQIVQGKSALNADNTALFWVFVALFVILCLMYFIFPAIYARATLENLQQGKAGAVIYADLYEDTVHMRNSSVTGKTVFPYDIFVRCEETADLLLLQNNRRQTLILPKEGIAGGSVDECKKFLQQKCTKAKIRWRRVL